MTSAPGTAARLARLLSEIDGDLAALDARAAGVAALLSADERAEREIIVLAVEIHGWYTALETLLERIARLLDSTTPAGPAWHAELIAQMIVAVPGLRPAVLDAALGAELAEVRKFRHFFRNAYVLRLDARRVGEHGARVTRLHGPVAAGIGALAGHVRGVLDELSRS